MFSSQSDDLRKNSAFRRLDSQETNFATSHSSDLSISQEMMQVITAQNILIMKLLSRQNLLQQQISKKGLSSDSGSGQAYKENKNIKVSGYRQFNRQFNNLEQFSSSSYNERMVNQQNNNVKIIQKETHQTCSQKPLKKVDFTCQINSSLSLDHDNSELREEKMNEKKKQTETKNMIKNFAKAIFGFIRKNRDKKLQVLHSLGIKQEQFMRVYDKLKGHIHSISELRSLWIKDGNPYSKVFRILSAEYLRKHCLQKTFNSRIENYSVHLKYNKRLLEGLADPEDFTVLKTN